MTFIFSVKVLLLISVTVEADAKLILRRERPAVLERVSERSKNVVLECKINNETPPSEPWDWYHQNKWLYASDKPWILVQQNHKNAQTEKLYLYSSWYSRVTTFDESRLTIRVVQDSTNGLYECRNANSLLSDSLQLFLLVPSKVSSLLLTIDGESPPPNAPYEVEEGEHIVQCTAAGFNPNSTTLTILLSFAGKLQNVTSKSRVIDTEAAVAAKADRFRATWSFTVRMESFQSGQRLMCNETESFNGSYAIRLSVRKRNLTVSSLSMTIDGESPPPNTTLNIQEGEHTVQCTAVASTTQLDIQLFLGNHSQPVTAKLQETDKETVTARSTWNFTVTLKTTDSGKRLVCKETVSFVEAHGIRVNVSAISPQQEQSEDKLSLTSKVAISAAVGVPALLGTCLVLARYCNNVSDLFSVNTPSLPCFEPASPRDGSSSQTSQSTESEEDRDKNTVEGNLAKAGQTTNAG